MERTLNKNKQPPSQKFDDRAGYIRFGRTDASTPGPDDDPPGEGPNKLWLELTLNGAGAATKRATEVDIPQPVINWLNGLCDDAADELEG